MYLTDYANPIQISTVTAGAAGTSAITSSAVDMAGYDGCLFIVPFGAIVSGAVTSLKLQQCDTTGGSYADLAGTSQTVADTDDDKTFIVDIQNPQEQFLKLVVSRATQNATVGGIYAIPYHKASRSTVIPVAGTNAIGGVERFLSPAEGTA
jgi:hypothetical protein